MSQKLLLAVARGDCRDSQLVALLRTAILECLAINIAPVLSLSRLREGKGGRKKVGARGQGGVFWNAVF